ncbi:CD209 antigen-like protein E [Protopterus annectens]|uniref:CD209 antigen-like protein E n=1 Tax=Protopterus annectens TaxID=7888 RepID=UPI001CF960E9|nr:CD209 antigen-like protein E [Protopterus annectens]
MAQCDRMEDSVVYADLHLPESVAKTENRPSPSGRKDAASKDNGHVTISCLRTTVTTLFILSFLLLISNIVLIILHFSQVKNESVLQVKLNEEKGKNLNLTSNQMLLQSQLDDVKQNFSMVNRKYEQLAGNVSRVRDEMCITPDNGTMCVFCPPAWKFFKNSCYLFSNEMQNWNNSRHRCLEMKSDLVIITDMDEMFFLGKGGDYWIGLTDQVVENSFRWVDGTSHDLNKTQFWSGGEPNNKDDKDPEGEDCVVLTFKFNDLSCSKENKWICEKKPIHFFT